MEPPKGFWASFWNFICFLPFFTALLMLGFIKDIIMFPLIFLVITIGISGVILGLWPLHCLYTYYTILSTRHFCPALKLVLCKCFSTVLVSWPPVGIACSILGGAAFSLFAPMFAIFQAIEEGKKSKFYHCIFVEKDGTWGTVQGSCTIVPDFSDFLYYSFLSIMDDSVICSLALIAEVLGIMTDLPLISIIAICKSPYMLLKGWHRLLHDCIGRKGLFLETLCVPFAGLAILLWPLDVAAVVSCSVVSSVVLGAYAAVIIYQESSFWFGLCYFVSSVSLYDEYNNDVLDLPEGSCFPKFVSLARVSDHVIERRPHELFLSRLLSQDKAQIKKNTLSR